MDLLLPSCVLHLGDVQEKCTNHACVAPQPSSTTYSWTDPSNPATLPIAVTPWFCSEYVTLDYPARVANGTGADPL